MPIVKPKKTNTSPKNLEPAQKKTEKTGYKTPDYSKITRKKSYLVHKTKLIYQNRKFDIKKKKWILSFNVYELAISEGTYNFPLFLLTSPKTRIRKEKQWLRIKPLANKELKLKFANGKPLDKIQSHYPPPLCNNEKWKSLPNSEKWQSLLHHNILSLKLGAPFLFVPTKTLTDKEIEEIKTWDFDELEHDFFYEGLEKDERVVYPYRCQRISFAINPYTHEDTCKSVQPYNSHAICVTLTKRGKTTTGKKTGKVYSTASSSRLTGFSTGDSTYSGDADGETIPFFLDNVQTYRPEVLLALLELMETGVTITGKGKQTVVTSCLIAFIFHANPPDVKDAAVLASEFEKIIDLLTQRIQGPIGSRFSMIFFSASEEVKAVSGTHALDKKIVEKNKLVFNHVITKVNKKVSESIFPTKKIQVWINKKIDGYSNHIEKFIKTANQKFSKALCEFWRHHAKYGYRHIRGAALKQAIMDNLKAIYLGNYSIDMILEDADVHLDKICDMNISSLKNLINVFDDVPSEEWALTKFDTIKSLHAKAVVLAVAAFAKENPETVKRGVMMKLDMLKKYYDDLPSDCKSKGYLHFSKVLHKIPAKLEKFNLRLGNLGFRLVEMSGKQCPVLTFTNECNQIVLLSKKLFPEKTDNNSITLEVLD